MPYQSQSITSLADIPAHVSSFAAAQGWTVDTTDPDAPVFTLPTPVASIDWQLSADETGFDHTLKWEANGSAVPLSTAQLQSPKLEPDTGTDPDVPAPTDVHIFVEDSSSDNPYIALVVAYPDGVHRHLYLGSAVKHGDYTGGELIAGCNGPVAAIPGGSDYRDYDNVQYLFQSRSALFAAAQAGGGHFDHADNADNWRTFKGSETAAVSDVPDDCALGGFGDGINDGFLARGEAPFNGVNMLVPINLYAAKPITSEKGFIPVGYPPGVRMVHMKNLPVGASIDVGGVQWRVFPALKKSSETLIEAGSNDWSIDETSYYVGYAYKEN